MKNEKWLSVTLSKEVVERLDSIRRAGQSRSGALSDLLEERARISEFIQAPQRNTSNEMPAEAVAKMSFSKV